MLLCEEFLTLRTEPLGEWSFGDMKSCEYVCSKIFSTSLWLNIKDGVWDYICIILCILFSFMHSFSCLGGWPS